MTDTLRAILFGGTLEDKLQPIADLEAALAAPVLDEAPSSPGRAGALAFAAPKIRAPFPKPHALADADERAIALHFFANHELLAIELMALALLRFPSAPEAFRLGLVRTLSDEQRHLAGYVARLAAHGTTFGDLPLNAYFWRTLAGCRDPRAFCAGMSLTLEQANLDFSHHYAALFGAAGDLESAALLEAVFRDEIAHVRHGATWLRRLSPAEAELFASYEAVLPWPLVAAQGRGPAFSRAARLEAGLDAPFIAKVEAARQKNRSRPDVWLFNVDLEEQLAGVVGPPATPVAQLSADLAGLALIVARPGDVAVVSPPPSTEQRERLEQAGWVLPRIVEGLAQLSSEKLQTLRPFGASPSLVAAAGALDLLTPFAPVPGELATKSFAASLLPEILEEAWPEDLLPRVVRDRAEVMAYLPILAAAGHGSALLKAPLSASGRHRIRVPLTTPVTPEMVARIERLLELQGSLRIEPWLPIVAELSVQLDLADDDREEVLGIGRFLTAQDGRYQGHVLAPFNLTLDPELWRVLPPRHIVQTLEQSARKTGGVLKARGYHGYAGIDAFLFRDPRAPGGVRLHPLSEINPRMTMGHVALKLRAKLHPGRVGLWKHLPVSSLRTPPSSWPKLELDAHTGRWRAGILPTTDPSTARRIVTVLAVGDSLAVCDSALAAL